MRFAILFTLCLLSVASAHSLNKRFINSETIKQHAAELKAKLDNLKDSLMSHFHHKPAAVEGSDAEVAVEKRDIHEIFEKMSKFAQTKTQAAKDQLRKILDKLFKPFNNDAEDTTEHPLAKRGLFDALERMNTKAQASAKKVFDRLQKTISSIFAPFKKPATRPVEDSTEKPVAKRSIFDRLERMNEKVQAHAQKAFEQLRKVFDELFKKHPDAHGIEVEIQDGNVVTERIIKRDIFDFFGELNEKLQDQAAKIFGNLGEKFGNIIKHDDDEDEEELDLDFDDEEDSTEISVEKRDIFDWFGSINERFQDKASHFIHHLPKPHLPAMFRPHNPMARPPMPPHGFNMPNPFAHKPHPPKPAPKPEDEVEEIEVVTAA